MIPVDLRLPLKFTASGDAQTTRDADLVAQWAQRTLVAEPGATVFWPTWGVGVESHVGINEIAARASLAARIRKQITASDKIDGVTVGISPGGGGRVTVSATIALTSGERATVSAEVS